MIAQPLDGARTFSKKIERSCVAGVQGHLIARTMVLLCPPTAEVPMPDPAPAPEPPSGVNLSRAWELVKDALALAVVPLVAWVVNLSVANALRDERIASLQTEVAQVQTVKADLQKANVDMVRLEGKIDLANGRLDEIKSLLH